MNTQYEKNSIYIARLNYRMRSRGKRLKLQLTVFMTGLTAVCALLLTAAVK